MCARAIAVFAHLLDISLSGKHNLKKFGAEIQDRDVAKIIVHHDYNHTVFHNDIALLKLARPAEITNHVRTVCLWSESTDLNGVLDKLGTVIGWGFDENGQLTSSLMQARMPVVSSIKCVYSNPDFFSRFTFDKSYCAGFRNGNDIVINILFVLPFSAFRNVSVQRRFGRRHGLS